MSTPRTNRIQSTYGLTTRTDNTKRTRRGSRTAIKFGPEIDTADKLAGPGSEARHLMEFHRERAQEAISNAIARGADKTDALRFARGHLLAGQKAQIQYRAELGLA